MSNFSNLAAIIKGNDIYPPVEKTFSIFFFLKNNNDLKIKNRRTIKFIGIRILLFNFGVFIIIKFSKFLSK